MGIINIEETGNIININATTQAQEVKVTVSEFSVPDGNVWTKLDLSNFKAEYLPVWKNTLNFYDKQEVKAIHTFENGEELNYFKLNETNFYLFANTSNFSGIKGSAYWGANYTDLSFVQKRFVVEYVADALSNITVNLDDYYTKTQVDGLVASTYKAKGSVNSYSSLPTSNQKEGDVWNLIDTGENYVWVLNLNNTGNPGWDKLSGTVDLTNYYTKSESNTNLAAKLDKPTADGSWVITKSGSTITFTSASTLGQNIFNTAMTLAAHITQNLNGKTLYFQGGKVKVDAVHLAPKAADSIPDKIYSTGTAALYNPTSGVTRIINTGTVFNYTPTADFTLSALKTAMGTAGYNFDDATVCINIGSNSFVCTVNNGLANMGKEIYFKRLGTGSLSFVSTRTLNAGGDNITIMNGNENSIARLVLGTTTDFLTIINS